MEEQIRKFYEMGVSYEALPDWKKRRRQIVGELTTSELHDCEGFRMPSNAIRSNMKLQLKNVKVDDQEIILFDDFMTLCHGFNTPTIQCELDENEEDLKFSVSPGADEGLVRWLQRCFSMVVNLFYLECSITRLRADVTRGPVVSTFCAVVAGYLRKEFYPALAQLDKLPRKNLLTLQRKCVEFNNVIDPLKCIALDIERFDYVGGELINILSAAAHSDRQFHVAGLLQKVTSSASQRYYAVVLEWISQCTLTLDLTHEFFIWDLSKIRCVKRTEFPNSQSDGTQFDNRFVIISELCPDFLKPISAQVVEIGKFLHIMQSQGADLGALTSEVQASVEREFRDKSTSQLRALIRTVHSICSTAIMGHLSARCDLRSFSLRLPNYFFGLRSTCTEELTVLYEKCCVSDFAESKITGSMLGQLLDLALEKDWLGDDAFCKKFKLNVSPFYKMGNSPALELDQNWDSSLNLVVPNHILEIYRRLFRLVFLLQRARHLLHRKRFFDSTFRPNRQELASLFLMIRFVNVYHDLVFVTVLEEAYNTMAAKIPTIRNLPDLVEVQWTFLCRILGDACLDVDKKFTTAIMDLIVLFSAYARNEMDIDSLTQKAAPLISFIKKMFLKNRAFANLRNIFFGANFHSVGEADFEPLWMSLRHIEPIK